MAYADLFSPFETPEQQRRKRTIAIASQGPPAGMAWGAPQEAPPEPEPRPTLGGPVPGLRRPILGAPGQPAELAEPQGLMGQPGTPEPQQPTAMQNYQTILGRRPEPPTGLKSFLGRLATSTPIGQMAAASIPGTQTNYDERLVRAGEAAGVEQAEQTAALGRRKTQVGIDLDVSQAGAADALAEQRRRPPVAPAAPLDREIDTYTAEDGTRTTVFQKPDGSTYERQFGKVASTADESLQLRRDIADQAHRDRVSAQDADERRRRETQTAKDDQQRQATEARVSSVEADLDRMAEAANELKNHPGLGGATDMFKTPGFIGGTHAAGFRTNLTTLRSQIAFSTLQKMREMSKTGGALGQVSDKEGQLLQDNIAGLSEDQRTPEFVKALDKIIKFVADSKARLRAALNADATDQDRQRGAGRVLVEGVDF